MPHAPAPARLRRLECIRGAAALYVFAHHYVHVVLKPHYPGLGRLFVFGQAAVLVFFVVSGFVIYYSTHARGRSLVVGPYVLRRFRRIYPTFVAALGLTWVAHSLSVGRPADPQWRQLLGNLAMLQDQNVAAWFSPYLDNSALWSLSYEWAFYMLFVVVWALAGGHRVDLPRAARRQLGVVAVGAIAAFFVHRRWPNQIALFVMYLPIWWVGVEFAREYLAHGRVTLRRQWGPIALVGVLVLLWAGRVYEHVATGQPFSPWRHPVFELRHFVTALLVGGGGLAWARLRWWGFGPLFGRFERIAPISYGLYIVHKPFMHLAAQQAPIGNPWLELVWVVPVVLLASWLVERWLFATMVRWMPAGGSRR